MNTPKRIGLDMRGQIRLSALASLINSAQGKHLTNYRSDLLHTGADLGLNALPCAVCIRDCGVELCFDASDVRRKTTVFGDKEGVAEWYYGDAEWLEEGPDGRRWLPGDPKKYSYTFTRATADECFAFLKTHPIPDDSPFANNLYQTLGEMSFAEMNAVERSENYTRA